MAGTEQEMTPMMRQYVEAKAEYPDCILFFRLGDFYEMFFDDAVTAAGVLGRGSEARLKTMPQSFIYRTRPNTAARPGGVTVRAESHRRTEPPLRMDPSAPSPA